MSIELHSLDLSAELTVVERQLPHWSQPGAIAFITWRTNDSIPARVLQAWRTERLAWLGRNGVDGNSDDWRTQISMLPTALRIEFARQFSDRWHEALDACHGNCVLKRPELGRIVADSLLHFDGDRYELTDFVVMPNHVHILAAFRHAQGMLEQCESWKRFQATKINRVLGSKGRFWQQDEFDHLVRSNEQFHYLRGYIAENGRRAKLAPHEYIHYTKRLKQ